MVSAIAASTVDHCLNMVWKLLLVVSWVGREQQNLTLMCPLSDYMASSKIDYQPQGRYGKLATVKDSKTDVSSVSPLSEWIPDSDLWIRIHSDEGLMLETSVFKSFTVANFTLSILWLIIYFSVSLSHRRSTQFLSKLNPLLYGKLPTSSRYEQFIKGL